MYSFLTWCAEVRHVKPHWLLLEITVVDEQFYDGYLGDLYHVKTLLICPKNIGYPCSRLRRYSFLHLKTNTLHGGSPEQFQQLFGAACQLDGDIFLLASKEERFRVVAELASTQKNIITEEIFGDAVIPWSLFLTAKECQRVEHHAKRFRDGTGAGANRPAKKSAIMAPSLPCSSDSPAQISNQQGAYIADLDQGSTFSTGTRHMPCLLTHGKVTSISKGLVFTAQELLAAQGENLYAGPECDYKCLFSDLCSGFSERTLKHMAGNSMHMPTVGLWLLYNLSELEVLETSVNAQAAAVDVHREDSFPPEFLQPEPLES
jgi:hypothetical protein